MGKYLPVIRTAECGSLNRAAQALGYTQPSLAYIINNIESELEVKLFLRGQRGVTLTEEGTKLLTIMRQIEEMEEKLHQTARVGKNGLLRIGIFPSIASLWLPEVLRKFYEMHPDAEVKMEHLFYYLDGEQSLKEHRLDCCFFASKCPAGLEAVELWEDPYYLLVPQDSDLAQLEEVAAEEVAGKYPFIPTTESFDEGSAIWEVYQALSQSSRMDYQPQENRMAVSMVEAGLGVAVLPGLDLMDLSAGRKVKAVPLVGGLSRMVSMLCPPESERSELMEDFLDMVQATVATWEEAFRAREIEPEAQ
ncbi:MAG: LysR family transcriptional regulator [Ruminiclostridium sp.]|nr:LysR family transcriptional regulator [Ruminiclostridium sp.]